MISVKFEDEIWIYFQTNLSSRTRKEYWNIVKDFDRLTGHDPMKLTRKEALNYYNNLIEKVNSNKLSYNTAVMRLSVMKSVCTFIETYTVNHGKRYINHFESMSLPEQDKRHAFKMVYITLSVVNRIRYCLKMQFLMPEKLIICSVRHLMTMITKHF